MMVVFCPGHEVCKNEGTDSQTAEEAATKENY